MIYLDHAATTFASEAALCAFNAEARSGANPSSLHAAGFAAHVRLEEARAEIARTLFVKPETITFTSGGTESANLAILGVPRRGTVLCSDAEHACVSEALKVLAQDGMNIIKIPTAGGVLDLDALRRAADESVTLACFMRVNNETGAVYDIAAASRIVKAKAPRAQVYADCAQGYLKEPLSPEALGADLISLSAHKVCGVRGTGALYHRKGLKLKAQLLGGGQESGLRSGTENTPGIAAFAAAAREGFESLLADCAKMEKQREAFCAALSTLDGVEVLSPPHAVCHIVSASFAGYKSEVLLHLLSDAGIYASSGSACSSHKGAKSAALLAYGIPPARADGTLRFSLGKHTTAAEWEQTVSVLREILKEGRHRI